MLKNRGQIFGYLAVLLVSLSYAEVETTNAEDTFSPNVDIDFSSPAKDEAHAIGSQRIVGGQIIKIAQAPYIVQLRDSKGVLNCGGTLVTPQHVVTAAHCLDFVNATTFYTVIAGAETSTGPGINRRVISWHKPNDYNRRTFHRDVAILKLDSPIRDKKVTPLSLCENALRPGDQIQVTGWGRTKTNGPVSRELRTIRLPVISQKECEKYFTLTNTMVCGLRKGMGPCQMDSGGPVVSNGKLCGIVSWGNSNCKYDWGIPAVYTSIDAVRSYIKKALI